MTRLRLAGGMTALAATVALATPAADVTERRTLEESFALEAGGRVAVDNVSGSIRVSGVAGTSVRLEVTETVRAEDREALDRARREVRLLTEADGRDVDLYVDGPFRDRQRRGWVWRDRHPGYHVSHDFELQIPHGARIELSTVNDGEIRVDAVHGDFDVSNVNGGIEMRDLRGSGSVHTVNGPITARFSRAPLAASDFRTVNGDVEVFFPTDLAAELELITRFGELWSEFDLVSLPAVPAQQHTEGGRTVIRLGDPLLRVGGGGPRLTFETLNGDVLIRKHAER